MSSTAIPLEPLRALPLLAQAAQERNRIQREQSLEHEAFCHVHVGDVFYESWGYDQTNIDFLRVVALSPTGKTAICRMMSQKQVKVGEGYAPMTEHVVPDKEYGEEFRLRAREYQGKPELAGSYPYCSGDKRLGYFRVWDGTPLYQSHYA